MNNWVDITTWKVYHIQVHPQAYIQNKRFLDVNMNRIWKHLDQVESYEVQRFEELLPILDILDVAIDIHSTSLQTWSLMWIGHSKDSDILSDILVTDRLLIDPHFDQWWSLMSFMTQQWKLAYGIECGSHTQADAYINALQNIYSLLLYTWSITQIPTLYKTKKKEKSVYSFFEEVFPLSEQFVYTKEYQNFDPISPGETYATDGDYIYTNETDNTIYIGIIWKKPRVGDGVCFLFQKT